MWSNVLDASFKLNWPCRGQEPQAGFGAQAWWDAGGGEPKAWYETPGTLPWDTSVERETPSAEAVTTVQPAPTSAPAEAVAKLTPPPAAQAPSAPLGPAPSGVKPLTSEGDGGGGGAVVLTALVLGGIAVTVLWNVLGERATKGVARRNARRRRHGKRSRRRR